MESFKGWRIAQRASKYIPIDGTHHHPHAEGVSHPLSNSFIDVKFSHGLGGLFDIPRHLKWYAFIWIESCIFLCIYPLLLFFYLVSSILKAQQ